MTTTIMTAIVLMTLYVLLLNMKDVLFQRMYILHSKKIKNYTKNFLNHRCFTMLLTQQSISDLIAIHVAGKSLEHFQKVDFSSTIQK